MVCLDENNVVSDVPEPDLIQHSKVRRIIRFYVVVIDEERRDFSFADSMFSSFYRGEKCNQFASIDEQDQKT